MKRLVLGAVAAALACAPAASAGEAAKPDRACFWMRNLRGHTSDGERFLYLDVGGRAVFRVETRGGCLSTGSPSEAVVLQSRSPGGQVCSALDLDLTVHGARCIVDTLSKLSPGELAALPRPLQPQGRISLEPPPRGDGGSLIGRGDWVVGIGNRAASPR